MALPAPPWNPSCHLINRYKPELLYFDDTVLPLWPVSDAGLKIAAHFYNRNLQDHPGDLRAVLFGKILTQDQRKAIVWDVERGTPNRIESPAWQTDTCIGGWHYDRSVYENNGYKSAAAIIRMLADIVSKNGNLLLSIPVRGDGSIDEKEEKILEDIAAWMDVNQEAIFGIRPWKIFGEGPASEGAPIVAQGFNEGKGKPLTSEDIRFTTKGDTLYAIVLGVPDRPVTIRSLGSKAPHLEKPIVDITQLGGSRKATWTQSPEALVITPSADKPADDAAVVFKITMGGMRTPETDDPMP